MREVLSIREHPEHMAHAAAWFHAKWGIPLAAYEESMRACIRGKGAVPQWIIVVEGAQIIAGLGVIENDFHDRPDLGPNVCAVYVEKAYRKQGIAGEMLRCICRMMALAGVERLYLVTDHTSFYERYGWSFLCMVHGDGEPRLARMYVIDTGTA